MVNNGYQVGKRNELDQKHHKICVQNPFFHAFGLTITIMAALNFGSTIVVPHPSYSTGQNVKTIKEEK